MEIEPDRETAHRAPSVLTPEDFFARKGRAIRNEPVLARIRTRRRVADQVFLTAKSFSDFLARRLPDPEVHKAWLRQATAVNEPSLQHLAARSGRSELLNLPDAEKYHALVVAGYVDPALDFPDVLPALEPVCNLMATMEKYPDGDGTEVRREVRDELRRSVEYFKHRWELLTGVIPFEGQPPALPRVGDLVSRKAPVPLQTGWSPGLAAAEARAMHHRLPGDPVPAAGGRPQGNGAAAPAEGRAVVAEAGEGAAASCDLDEIFRRAGASRPHQPAGDDPRYTFPGTLGNREEIFYDYVVIRPVGECGPFRDEVAYDDRDLAAPHLLAARARSVLLFLRDMHLDDALGQRVVQQSGQPVRESFGYDRLNAVLDGVEALAANTPLADVRAARRSLLREAAALRLIGRTEINLAAVGAHDPAALREGLEEAMARFNHLDLTQDFRIAREPELVPPQVNYLKFRSIHPVNGGDLTPGDVSPTQGHYFLEIGNQDRHTKHYLEYLGSTFYDNVTHLRGKVGEVAAALQSLETPAGFFREQFTDLATDLIYQALFALARLLEEAAETLDLPPRRRRDGSKRLAVMLVYRQHWYPAGYVKGKLVGYKNLAPNQKDRVSRRTFVRTTRETTTAQEFAATRSQEYSQSLKETAEFVRENASRFNFTTSASGHFDIAIGGIDASVQSGLDLSQTSRVTQTRMAETVAKASVLFNEKREVKVREQVEAEEAVEVTSELHNANQEITANYFYYQLLRQYEVVTEFHDLRPVLLRTREMPAPAEIDDGFLNAHAHALIGALPLQLAADLQSTVHQIEPLARAVIRARVDMEQRTQAYEFARRAPPPADPQERQNWEARLQSLERVAADVRSAFAEAESAYLPARARLDRVVAHVRRNVAYYAQYLWQSSPTVDHDMLLAEETFGGVPLPDLTRGLIRQGYYGDEEVFEFDGETVACADLLARHAVSGRELLAVSGLQAEPPPALALLRDRFALASDAAVRDYVFVRDPAGEGVINRRTVQLAQEALVVETMPGQVPLLEGFKLAHRALDVRKACLENEHLAARIADRPWANGGEDTYRVIRREAEGAPPTLNGEESS